MTASLVLRRRLAGELRALRTAKGLSQDEVAGHLDVSTNKIIRIEGAQSSVAASDLRLLLSLYDADAETSDRLLGLGRVARKRGGWWSAYRDLFPGSYIQLEAEASLVRNYEPCLVPGLLQTPDYARAAVRAADARIPPGEVERRVCARLKRQERLTAADPLRLHALIDEAVLRRRTERPDLMRAQLRRLTEAAALPNVTIGVLPFCAGIHPGLGHSFAILTFPEPVDPDVALFENRVGEQYLHGADELCHLHTDFRRMVELSLGPEATVRSIETTMREMGH